MMAKSLTGSFAILKQKQVWWRKAWREVLPYWNRTAGCSVLLHSGVMSR
jgi:hypothetical protein